MTVETFKICRRCQRIQQASLLVVGLWLHYGAGNVQDNLPLQWALQFCAVATLAAAVRFKIAALVNQLKR